MPRSSLVSIVDMYSGEEFVFQNAPAEVRERKGAVLKKFDIPGLGNPRFQATGGGERRITFSVDFWAEDSDQDEEWVREQGAWLMSLMYPRVVNTSLGLRRVTPVYLTIGELINLPIYVTNVNIAWGQFRDENMLPMMCRAELNCVEVEQAGEFIDAIAARRGAFWYRGFEAVNEAGSLSFFAASEDITNADFKAEDIE